MTCIDNPNAPPSSGPNVGAIAGGVIGGVAFILLAVFVLWRFWIKKRREQQEQEALEWEEDDIAHHKSFNGLQPMRSDAASTRTRGSFANSILSRASNIIQIAYIPGVTNRNGNGHNSMAPVPPIPARYANTTPKSPLGNEGDALFFRPDDLRGSTYSASSRGSSKRDTQYTRQSITPSLARSSMASEVYRDDATTEPMPAITAARALPRMVSVKSSQVSSPTPSSHSDTSASTIKFMVPSQWQSATGPASLRNGSTGSVVRATQVTVSGQGKGRFPVRQASDASSAPSIRRLAIPRSPLVEISLESDTSDDEHARARRSLLTDFRESTPPPLIETDENPFADDSEQSMPFLLQPNAYASAPASTTENSPSDDKPPENRRLSAVIEDATKRASRAPTHDGIGGQRDISPFSDVHATQ